MRKQRCERQTKKQRMVREGNWRFICIRPLACLHRWIERRYSTSSATKNGVHKVIDKQVWMGHFQVALSLLFTARLSANKIIWKGFFINVTNIYEINQMKRHYHKRVFALSKSHYGSWLSLFLKLRVFVNSEMTSLMDFRWLLNLSDKCPICIDLFSKWFIMIIWEKFS